MPKKSQTDEQPEGFTRDTSLSIYQRIHCVMAEIEYVQKDGENFIKTRDGGTFSYKAVTHDNVTRILRPGLIKHGILLIPSVANREQVEHRTMIDVAVDVINVDDPKDKFTVTFTGYGDDYSDKGPGKAMSYAVKNCMLKLFQLVTGEDDEADYMSKAPIDSTDIANLRQRIKDVGRTEEHTCEVFNTNVGKHHGVTITSLEQLPKSLLPSLLRMITNAETQQAAQEKNDKGGQQ